MAEEKKEEKAAKGPAVCGHQNKHYIAPNHKDLQRTQLFCTLPAGHAGDHQSPYQTLRYGALKDAVASWSDAAGVELPKEILAKQAAVK